MTTASNPWAEEAQDLVGGETLHLSDLPRLKRQLANALARAYEYGFAQGRLDEIERARELPEGPKP